jgi:DNA-binding PadR family transcriptional regulator
MTVNGRRLGRFGETAMWILVALREGPRNVARLLDDVRALNHGVGPGTLYGAVARLERLALIEPTTNGGGRPAYRLHRPTAIRAAPTIIDPPVVTNEPEVSGS